MDECESGLFLDALRDGAPSGFRSGGFSLFGQSFGAVGTLDAREAAYIAIARCVVMTSSFSALDENGFMFASLDCDIGVWCVFTLCCPPFKILLHPLDPGVKGLYSCCGVIFRPSGTLF